MFIKSKQGDPMGEKRKIPRIPGKLNARFYAEGETEARECTIVELGKRGLGLRLHFREKIDFGKMLFIEIDHPQKEVPVKAEIIVMWRKLKYVGSEYIYMVGGEFGNTSEDEIDCLRDESFKIEKKEGSIF